MDWHLEEIEVEVKIKFVHPEKGVVVLVARDEKEIDILRPYLNTQNYIKRALEAKKELSDVVAGATIVENVNYFKKKIEKDIKKILEERTIPLPL
jgi:5-formaminoimidazole-4-carboxamide-1-beta-D-ribofuranosyl 5'-monophosphate synthetase